MLSFPFSRRANAALLLAAAVAACDEATVAPVVPVTQEITVDASAAPAYLRLDDTVQVVSVTTPTTSGDWDLSFFATTVTSNGGAAGPGGVTVACLCQNGSPTTAELQALSAASELADFEAVQASHIPANGFVADQLAPIISGWYTGAGASATLRPNRSWIVREGSGSGVVLAKFRVTQIGGPAATGPASLTIEYAVQPAPGQAFGVVQAQTLDLTAGPVYLDLTTGTTAAPANWDLLFDGWTIRVNGGVSGSGTVRAVVDSTTGFGVITAAYAAGVPAQAYRADAYSGAFQQQPWYRYNITGTDNQIWPTFQVYLVRRGSTVFKVQLTGYYGPTGAPRQVTVRHARLTE